MYPVNEHCERIVCNRRILKYNKISIKSNLSAYSLTTTTTVTATDLPHVLFLISAILLLSMTYLTNPPIIPNNTPPNTRLLNITIPCIGPDGGKERGREVRRKGHEGGGEETRGEMSGEEQRKRGEGRKREEEV